MNNQIAIKVCGLSKKYALNKAVIDEKIQTFSNDLWALNNISFEIKKGAVVGVIGANGSGKSTLLKILSGITKPTKGEAVLTGRVASILDIGAGFHSELSGYENIFLHGQILGFKTAEIEQQMDEIINFSGIGNFINEPVKNYSNGMYLRLAFSIIMHLDFDIYLFDEVFNVGDIAFQEKSEERIKQLVAKNKTILMVSHNLAELKICDYTIELKNGEVVKENEPTIANYIKNYLVSTQKIIESGNVILDQFQDPSELINLKQIRFYQDNNNELYTASKPFTIELIYENNSTLELTPAFIIKDSMGQTLILAGPFLGATLDKEIFNRKDTVKLKCNIPKNLFSADIYNISLLFFENISLVFKASNFSQKQDYSQTKIVAHYDKLIHFKPLLEVNDLFVDFSKLNAIGGLLIDFEWGVQEKTTIK